MTTLAYLDNSAKHALDALVARLEEAVAQASSRTVAMPLEDLRTRLAGLGERESAVLERIDAIMGAVHAHENKDEQARQGLVNAVEAAAARTARDVTRDVEAGVERVLAGRLLELWGARLQQELQRVQSAQQEGYASLHGHLDHVKAGLHDGLGSVYGRVERLQQELGGLGQRLDDQAARQNARLDELNGLASQLESLRELTRRTLEAHEGGPRLTRDDLKTTADHVTEEIRRAMLPAASALDERLTSLTTTTRGVEEGLASLQAAHGRTLEALGSMEATLKAQGAAAPALAPMAEELGKELRAAIAPTLAAQTEQQSALEALRRSVTEAASQLADSAKQEQLSAISRAVEGLAGRLSFTQEHTQAHAAFVKRSERMAIYAIVIGAINAAAAMVVAGGLAARHLGW